MNAPSDGGFRDTAVLSILRERGCFTPSNVPDNPYEEMGSPVVHKNALFPHTRELSQLASVLASHFMKDDIEAVVGIGCAGAILAHVVAHNLGTVTDRRVHGLYVERSVGSAFSLQPSYQEFIRKHRVLIVDEELKQSGPAMALMKYIESLGGNAVGIACFFNRGPVTEHHFKCSHAPKLVSLLPLAR